MTAVDRDPVTLAREVLMRDAEAGAIDDRVGYDASSSLYVENGWSAPALARAAIELTAKVKRVEALAETWEEAARLVEARGGDAETVRDLLQDIRDALNGENA